LGHEEKGEEEERSRFGRAPAGTASEFRNTSPRMCSTYWAGTPDCCTGWVNTTCKPVALTVSSLELVVSLGVPFPSLEFVVVVEVVVVPVPSLGFVVVVEPVPLHGFVVVVVVSA
jgi:hypothetical protein